MRKDGSVDDSSLSSTLDRLLRDLSRLETCTTAVLDLVKSALEPSDNGHSQKPLKPATNRRPARSTRLPLDNARPAPELTGTKSTCSTRDVQRVVKTCLASLRNIKPCNPEPSQAIHEKLLTAKNFRTRPKILAAGDVLAIACTAALNTWTHNKPLESQDRVAIAKTRFNLSNRLLDLSILHTTFENLDALHLLLCLSPARPSMEARESPQKNISRFLRVPRNDLTSTEMAIVSSFELLVLRYLSLSSIHLNHNFIDALKAEDGPLAWSSRSTVKDNTHAVKYLTVMNRQLLKMAALVSDELRMQFYIILVQSLMDDPDETPQVTLTCFCRALDEECSQELFEQVECVAQRLLVVCAEPESACSEQGRLALCDRMTRLSQRLDNRTNAECWLTLRTSFEANSAASLSSSLDRCVLQISHAESADQCTNAMLDSTRTIKDLLRRNDTAGDDALLVFKSMSNLRLSTSKCVKEHKKQLQCHAQHVLSGLIELSLKMLPSCTTQLVSTSFHKLCSGLIYSWLSIVELKPEHDTCSDLLQQAEACRKLCDNEGLVEESQTLSISLFNWSGILYNSRHYNRASNFLLLYFRWNPPTTASIKQVEYLWSSYLKCDDYEQAFTWLLQSLKLTSLAIISQKGELSTQLMESSDMTRVSSKILQLSREHPDFKISNPYEFDNAARAIFLELLLNGLKQTVHDHWCLHKYGELLRELLPLYSSERGEQTRLLSAAISYYYVSGNRPFLATVLNLYTELVHVGVSTKSQAFSERLNHLRINAHLVLLQADTLLHSDTLLEAAISISSELDSQKDYNGWKFGVQVLSEIHDIFAEIHLPIHSIKTIHLQLHNYELAPASLDKETVIRLQTLAAEQYLACGYDDRASEQLSRAATTASNCNFPPIVSFDRAIITFKHAAVVKSEDLRAKLHIIGELLTKVPKHLLSQCRIKFLQCLSKFAENVGQLGHAIVSMQEALSIERRTMNQSTLTNKSILPHQQSNIAEDLQRLSLVLVEHNQIQSGVSVSLADILNDLGRLCEKAGLVKDATYYRSQALDVLEKLADGNLISKAHLLTNLLRCRAGLSASENVSQTLPQIQNPLEAVMATLASVELQGDRDMEESERIWLSCEATLEKSLEMNFQQSILTAPVSLRPTSRPGSRKAQAKLKFPEHPNVQLKQSLARLRCDMLVSYQVRNQTSLADAKFSQIVSSVSHQSADGLEVITMANYRLMKAEATLSKDPIYGALHDSALSLPSVCAVVPCSESRLRKQKNEQSQTQAASFTFLKEVLVEVDTSTSQLGEGFENWLRTGDSLVGRTCSHLHNTLNLLQAALRTPTTDRPIQSLSSNYFLENAKALPVHNERRKRSAEIDMVSVSNWQEKIEQITSDSLPNKFEFQARFIDNIPDNWVTVSIGLSPCGTSLVLSRLQANKSTLILRLPMSRHASRDVDEETFGFQDAKKELRDIIHQSDRSAQEAKFIKDKSGKAKWWALRQELDDRLATLMDNIEHCWLGGFLGIFGSNRESSSNPAHFRNAFARIILKHVPLKPTRSFDIDSRILDLFLDLDQLEGDKSLEVLEDLLYFVLDIYQFHGESIAYDEIDIDQMVVDIQVALSSHHGDSTAIKTGHTILVLDRSLHIFPWESLPCLRGRSISRVPSLTVLKDLLLQHQSKGLVVKRGPGRYILNPGSDLKSTERTLSAPLQSLSEWSGIVGRKPEEVEVITFLEDSSIFIYFGHGGGEQYIRGSKVKKLKSCGVVILMGCSSGALKEQGIFDPWGTPYNYCVANCPSLVVNLWDVTDKDIDRFSLKMLSTWSLTATNDKVYSICEAVAQSRDECVLRYLNGAAPVVYGLPLTLAPRTST